MNEPKKILLGSELESALTNYPEYDESIRVAPADARLQALDDVFQLFYPTRMAKEVYYRLFSLYRDSLKKKRSRQLITQSYENHKLIHGYENRGVMQNCSGSLFGKSGLGKSSAISRAAEIIGNDIIELNNPRQRIIPFLKVETPFDSSVKSLLLSILSEVDLRLDTHYYETAVKSRATTDLLIGTVSQVSLTSIGVIIIDECQNIINSSNGKKLVGSITQLINSGTNVFFVGVPEAKFFFEQSFYLSRRVASLEYNDMSFKEFTNVCRVLFRYQYTAKRTEPTDGILGYIYEHAPTLSTVFELYRNAQEIAILDGSEEINIASLEKAYRSRMGMLTRFISEEKVRHSSLKAEPGIDLLYQSAISPDDEDIILTCAKAARNSGGDVVEALMGLIPIESVNTNAENNDIARNISG